MAQVKYGVIEKSTGDLIRWGYSDFVINQETEELRTDLPIDSIGRGQFGEEQMHRWDGDEWILVDQPE